MQLKIGPDTELWELMAAIQVCQAHGITHVDFPAGQAEELLGLAGIRFIQAATAVELPLDKAYRQMGRENRPYAAVVATLAGLPDRSIKAPQFPRLGAPVGHLGGIVLAPFEIHESFKLPWQAWKEITRHLRTYGLPVTLLGRPGQRADYATFTEGSILSGLEIHEKLRRLALAHLVVGVPNEWTWAAAAWGKKIIVLHPDDIPVERWFGFDVMPRTLGRLLYTSSQLQIPVILAGLRKLIEAM